MEDIFAAAGLHDTLARCYLALLEVQQVTPAQLAQKTGESRSNNYKLLDELVERGLAERRDVNKKLHYQAVSPAHLLTIARERRDQLQTQEQQLKATLPGLLKKYYAQHEQPGVRFYQGKEGIKEVFAEQVRLKQPITFLKTREDIRFFGFEFMHEVRNLAPKAGIRRKAFTPDTPEVPVNVAESDQKMLLDRIWYDAADYTAPVEWSVYGNKVSIISFGQEAIATVIDSAQIAESMRQIFAMLEKGQKAQPNYDTMPTRAEYIDAPTFIKNYNNTLPPEATDGPLKHKQK